LRLLYCHYSLIKSTIVISNIYQVLIGIVVGIGIIFYYEGLKRLKAGQVSSLSFYAIFRIITWFFVLGETVTIMQYRVFVDLVGVYLLAKKRKHKMIFDTILTKHSLCAIIDKDNCMVHNQGNIF